MIVTCLIVIYSMNLNKIDTTIRSVKGVYIKQSIDSSKWYVNFTTGLKDGGYSMSLNTHVQWIESNKCLKGDYSE